MSSWSVDATSSEVFLVVFRSRKLSRLHAALCAASQCLDVAVTGTAVVQALSKPINIPWTTARCTTKRRLCLFIRVCRLQSARFQWSGGRPSGRRSVSHSGRVKHRRRPCVGGRPTRPVTTSENPKPTAVFPLILPLLPSRARRVCSAVDIDQPTSAAS